MYSRVGLPHSTSNMYNAMKDRTPLVLCSDHADTDREGADSHEDVDDWLEAVKAVRQMAVGGSRPPTDSAE